MDKIPRRAFTGNMFGSLLTFSLIKCLDQTDAFARPFVPMVRKWLIEMEQVTEGLRLNKVKPVEWQQQIESLLSRVELKDLLSAIQYEKLARNAAFPIDHESAEDIDLSANRGLPADLSFAPYFYALRKGVAIVPHGHRNMATMHMMLRGQAHCWQYERVSDEAHYLTIKPTIDKVLTVGAVSTISDEHNNIHWFKALSEPVFMFNIGVYGINSSAEFTGRDYIDPVGGEKLKDGMIRAKRIGAAEAYKLYGKS